MVWGASILTAEVQAATPAHEPEPEPPVGALDVELEVVVVACPEILLLYQACWDHVINPENCDDVWRFENIGRISCSSYSATRVYFKDGR